ncbi:MAG: hypothetical protein ABIL37_00220 [candidate division WOR-3 bacterium]
MTKAQVSLYVFNYDGDRGEVIREFWKIMKSYDLSFKANAFSTIIWSEDENKLFEAIFQAFKQLKKYGIVLDVKFSNIGPFPSYEISSKEI